MVNLQPIRRVTIYAAQGLEQSLIAQFRSLGVKGYTVVEARGVGSHPTADDPFARSSHVRIELLVNSALSDKNMEYLHNLHKQNQPITACLEDVMVADPEHF